MIIPLYNLPNFVGVLLPVMSSVCWSNHVGGAMNGRRLLQGVFIPLPSIEIPPTLKDAYNRDYDPALVQAFLDGSTYLKKAFSPLNERHEAEQKRFGLAEAWVPLVVSNYGGMASEMPELLPLKGKLVVLTHKNSK